MPEQTHKHAAIMFTDIVGYTALMGSDEKLAFEVLRMNQDIHSKLIPQFNGSKVKEMGDGMLANFDLASDAVRCAIEIQKESKVVGIPLKIGIHEGEMAFTGEDVLGDAVNIASRLQEDAEEGSISISSSVYKDVKNKSDINTEYVGEKVFKNVDEPVRVYRVSGEGEEQVTKIPSSKKGKKKYLIYLLSGIAIVVSAFLIWNYMPKQSEIELEKSIAVLPFANESVDPGNQYFVNGMMEDIRNNLSKIADLRVISRTSTEKYRDTNLQVGKIAAELNVRYLLEGTVQNLGDQVKIHAQLIDSYSDDHIWSDTYQRENDKVFNIQAEIAQTIAEQLHAIITPKELEVIRTEPTSDITAYDYLLQAENALENDEINRADQLFMNAIELDSTFAKAYLGLAGIYWRQNFSNEFFEEYYLDSVYQLINTALHFDKDLDEGHLMLANYYWSKGIIDSTIHELDRVIDINPNHAEAFSYRGSLLMIQGDWLGSLQDKIAGLERQRDEGFPYRLNDFGIFLGTIGFPDLGWKYYSRSLKLLQDSGNYYSWIAQHEYEFYRNFEKAIPYANKGSWTGQNGKYYLMNGEYEEAYPFYRKFADEVEKEGWLNLQNSHRIGHSFWMVGKKEEAMIWFNKQIKYGRQMVKQRRALSAIGYAHLDLALTYSFLGKTDSALYYIEEYGKINSIEYNILLLVKTDPLLENIRKEERYLVVLSNLESMYQREHDRVQKWIVESGVEL